MLSLRHIEVFLAVYQTGSISGAARLLGVSQPSVSKVLRHAETKLGLRLFDIVKGRLISTDEARTLFYEAREVRSSIDSFTEIARNLARRDQGSVRLIVPHSLGLELAPAAIAHFTHRHPAINIDIKTAHVEDMPAALNERQADFVLSFEPIPDPRITSIKLSTAEVVLLFHRSDIADPPAKISTRDIAGLRLIRVVNSGDLGALVKKYAHVDSSTRGDIDVQSYFVAGALVRHRLGIALMDEFSARGMLTGELDFRPIEERYIVDVLASHREDHVLSTAQSALLDSFRHVLEHRG